MKFQTNHLFWAVIAIIVVWYFLQPHNYEDCVLNGMANAKTESAMSSLRGACRKKFPSNYSATTQAKDLLKVTPPFPDLKSTPQPMTTFLGLSLGDGLPDLIYKFGNKSLTKDELEKYTLVYKSGYFVDIRLNKNDKVSYIHLSCSHSTKQTDLNGLYCGNDEDAIRKKYGTNVVIRCIQDRPTLRVAFIPKYNTAYYLESSKIIGLVVTNVSIGVKCN